MQTNMILINLVENGDNPLYLVAMVDPYFIQVAYCLLDENAIRRKIEENQYCALFALSKDILISHGVQIISMDKKLKGVRYATKEESNTWSLYGFLTNAFKNGTVIDGGIEPKDFMFDFLYGSISYRDRSGKNVILASELYSDAPYFKQIYYDDDKLFRPVDFSHIYTDDDAAVIAYAYQLVKAAGFSTLGLSSVIADNTKVNPSATITYEEISAALFLMKHQINFGNCSAPVDITNFPEFRRFK